MITIISVLSKLLYKSCIMIQSREDTSNQLNSYQIKTNQIKSNKDTSNRIESNKDTSNQIECDQHCSYHFMSYHIISNQIMSRQIQLYYANYITYIVQKIYIGSSIKKFSYNFQMTSTSSQM